MSILHEILAYKRKEVEAARAAISLENLQKLVANADECRGFRASLVQTGISVIAEYKRASPSEGVIQEQWTPEEVSEWYVDGGASALSILTDTHFFGGELSFLKRAKTRVPVPVLRKDFIIDEYQLWEARAHGADAVLLIVAGLSQGDLSALHEKATQLGLDVLVEVHSAHEAQRALDAGAKIVGVNHRDLRDFTIDLGLSERLRAHIPATVVMVGESGIRNGDDIRHLESVGVDAVLVGTHLMKADHPGQALEKLLRG